MMFAATFAISRLAILLQFPRAYRRWLGRGFRRVDAVRLAVKYFNL